MGKYYNKWKEAKVTHLYKGGEKHKCSTVDSTSVLATLPKIGRKNTFTHLCQFLQDHEVLDDNQVWFP